MSEREDDFATLRDVLLRDADTGTPAEFFQRREAFDRIQARVEALEGALREIEGLRDANPGEWMNAAYTIARAALAGEPHE